MHMSLQWSIQSSTTPQVLSDSVQLPKEKTCGPVSHVLGRYTPFTYKKLLNLFECVNHISTFDFRTLSVHWLADMWNREEVTAPYAEVLDGFGLLHPDSAIFHTQFASISN